MNTEKIKKYLIIGIIGAMITIAGEMSQGLSETVPATDMISETFSTYAALPLWRIGFGSTVGAIGILLQYFGVYAIYLSFKNTRNKASKWYLLGIYNYVFLGTIVHILMSVMILVYKMNAEIIIGFSIWFVLPFLVIFLIGYIGISLIMFQKFRRHETVFPSWCCLLNPVIGKLFFHIVAEIMPDSAVANGIGYSNMGLTAILMFSILLLTTKTANYQTATRSEPHKGSVTK